ncbi:MAG: flavin reductase family protein [Terriglobales bacterium]
MSENGSHLLQPRQFMAAMSQVPTGVCLVAVRDDLDDLITTASSLVSVSLDPPLISVCTDRNSYFGEVMSRSPRWALTVLAQAQRHLAARFAARGRPSARLLLEGEAHHRGAASHALIVDGAVMALEFRTVQRIPAGDHYIIVAEIISVDYLDVDREPLVRHRRGYRGLT